MLWTHVRRHRIFLVAPGSNEPVPQPSTHITVYTGRIPSEDVICHRQRTNTDENNDVPFVNFLDSQSTVRRYGTPSLDKLVEGSRPHRIFPQLAAAQLSIQHAGPLMPCKR